MRHLYYILVIFLILNVSNLKADNLEKQLDRLFNDLKIENASSSHQTEQKIWKLWSTHPNNDKLTVMLAKVEKFKNIRRQTDLV